ncbi:MAG: CPBP family intramembrane metalloprotease [Lachnospiraceae bacterium]|nr:CPBP family intramembrane metalloprotease [Lachnospiraceae bacterium]
MQTFIINLLTGVLMYFIFGGVLIFYVRKIEKAPLSSLGLKKIHLSDIAKGLVLGICMFIAQQIPLLILKMDYSAYAMAPDPVYIIIMSLYCFLCVGFVEELIFRGFILQKTLVICHSKTVSILVNILLFYAVHFFPAMRFSFGEFYNVTVNVLFLSIYFFKSKDKTLIPLIVAHGFYDTLTSVVLPIIIYGLAH